MGCRQPIFAKEFDLTAEQTRDVLDALRSPPLPMTWLHRNSKDNAKGPINTAAITKRRDDAGG